MSDNLAMFWSSCRANLYGNEMHCHNWFCFTCCLHSKYVSMSSDCCWASVLVLPRRFSLTIFEERSHRFLSRDFPKSKAKCAKILVSLACSTILVTAVKQISLKFCPVLKFRLNGSFHSPTEKMVRSDKTSYSATTISQWEAGLTSRHPHYFHLRVRQ